MYMHTRMCVLYIIWLNIKYNYLKFCQTILGLFPSSCNTYETQQDIHRDTLSGIHVIGNQHLPNWT